MAISKYYVLEKGYSKLGTLTLLCEDVYDPGDESLGTFWTAFDEFKQLGTAHAEGTHRAFNQSQYDALNVRTHGCIDTRELVDEILVLGKEGQVETQTGARC